MHTHRHDTTQVPREHLAALLVDAIRLASRLRAELADVQADRDSYREIAQQGMHALAERERHARRQTARIEALVAEIRRYTAARVDARRAA